MRIMTDTNVIISALIFNSDFIKSMFIEISKPIIMTPREFFDEYLYYKKIYAF